MTLYLLDTDHISLAQRGHPRVVDRIAATPPEQLAVSIISAQEQMQGRLAQVRRARDVAALLRVYRLLYETLVFYSMVTVLPFDEQAAAMLYDLLRRKIRIGTLDLRIAAIALAAGAVLVTANRRDFERVPGLMIQNWSL